MSNSLLCASNSRNLWAIGTGIQNTGPINYCIFERMKLNTLEMLYFLGRIYSSDATHADTTEIPVKMINSSLNSKFKWNCTFSTTNWSLLLHIFKAYANIHKNLNTFNTNSGRFLEMKRNLKWSVSFIIRVLT